MKKYVKPTITVYKLDNFDCLTISGENINDVLFDFNDFFK